MTGIVAIRLLLADALGTLLGHPVVLDQFVPNIAATNKARGFGDFKQGSRFATLARSRLHATHSPTLQPRVRLGSLVTGLAVRS